MIAKIAADKGVSFDFTNNQKLRDSGFALDGKTVNGFIKDGNISLNIESAKALNTVVGHEITHVLEGTELYDELQKAVKTYAESKGEYGKRLVALQKLYEGVKGANIENELTADLVGDYLFTDSDFVNRLSTEKPGLFKRIYEEIKYLVKTATAGSKQARELEKVKRAFEKAYRESRKSTDGSLKYSISDTLNNDLQKVLNNTFDASKSEIYLGKTSDFLVDTLKAESLEMLMPAKKAYAAMATEEQSKKEGRYDAGLNYHGLGKEKLLEALNEAEDPIAVYVSDIEEDNSKKREKRIVLITEAKQDGNYIAIVNEVSSAGMLNGKKVEANVTITVFNKDNIANALMKAKSERRILHLDKKRSHLIARGEERQTLNSLNDNDLSNNITDFWNNVNYKKGNLSLQSEKIDNNVMMQALEKALGKGAKLGYSLGEDGAPIGTYNVRGKDIALDLPIRKDLPQTEEIAPVQQSQALKELGPIRKDVAPVKAAVESTVKDIGPVRDDIVKQEDSTMEENAPVGQAYSPDELPTWEHASVSDGSVATDANTKLTRKDLHANIMDNISAVFTENGYNFDDVLSNAKNLSTFRTVDNTPQRVMEKALGYKEGQILSDLTVNQVAQMYGK